MKYPDDETYPQLMVNYVKLDRVPKFKESWSPVMDALRAGNYFVTSGEVLLRNWSIEGTGAKKRLCSGSRLDVSSGFRRTGLERWKEGRAPDYPPYRDGAIRVHKFRIPFDAAGKKWVRFADLGLSRNGAFTQPVHLR